jgi:hypothetical protein
VSEVERANELSRTEEIRFAMRAACVHESWGELEYVLEELFDLVESGARQSSGAPSGVALDRAEGGTNDGV